MATEKAWGRLRNNDAVTRTIRVEPEGEGTLFFVEVTDTSLVSPKYSWTLFGTLPDAEAGAKAQYEASLKEGFKPLS